MPKRTSAEGNSYFEMEFIEEPHEGCPFCGCTKIQVDWEAGLCLDLGVAFSCVFCGYVIIFDEGSVEEALKLWNNRPQRKEESGTNN